MLAFVHECFPPDYVPTIHDNMGFEQLTFRDKRVENWSLWDTAGEEEYARLRALSYPETRMFLVAFSVCSRSSFDAVTTKWVPEVKLSGPPNTPFLLVGMQSDRRGKGEKEIELAEIQEKVRETEAIGYVECSSKYGTGLREVFDTVMEYLSSGSTLQPDILPKKQKKKECSVM